jgi:hypothetical protein
MRPDKRECHVLSWWLRPHQNRNWNGCALSAQSSFRYRTTPHGKLWTSAHFPEPTEHLFIRLTTTISLPATEPWDWKFWKICRMRLSSSPVSAAAV